MIDIKTLNKIYSDTLNKPENYHHICYGGGTVKMVDVMSDNPKYKCKYQGDKNWMTPACEYCNGLCQDKMELSEYQENTNYGMRRLYKALKQFIEAQK